MVVCCEVCFDPKMGIRVGELSQIRWWLLMATELVMMIGPLIATNAEYGYDDVVMTMMMTILE